MTALLNAAAIAVVLAGLLAMAVHCARRARSRTRYTIGELNDFSRDDIPEWPHARGPVAEGLAMTSCNPAAELHDAARLMREQHGPEHVRHAFWNALADLLAGRAAEYDGYAEGPYGSAGAAFVAGAAGGDVDPVIAVARAYRASVTARGDIDPDWPQVRGTMPGPDEGASP